MATRRLTIEIGGDESAGRKALRSTGDELDKLGDKAKDAGREAEQGLDRAGDAAGKLGGKLRDVGGDATAGLGRLGARARETDDRFRDATRGANDYGRGLEGVGERADEVDTRAMGAADGFAGLTDAMRWNQLTAQEQAMVFSDFGSSMYNFVIPSLTSVRDSVTGVVGKLREGGPEAAKFKSNLKGLAVAGTVAVGLAAVGAGIDQINKAESESTINELAADFLAAGDAATTFEETVGQSKLDPFASGARELVGTFDRLIAQGPDVAQRWIDSAIAAGASRESMARFQEIVDKTAAADEGLAEIQNRVNSELVDGAIKGGLLDRTMLALQDSTAGQVEQLNELSDSLRAQFDPLFGMVDAMQDNADANAAVLEAEAALAEARRVHGRRSDEATLAEQTLASAQRDAAGSAFDLNIAANELTNAVRTGAVQLDEARWTLGTWVSQGIIAQSTADEMAREFDVAAWSSGGMASQMDRATGSARNLDGVDPTVITSLIDNATGPLSWLQGRVDNLDGRVVDITVWIKQKISELTFGWLPAFDVGGVVPGPVGSPQLALVHGGETIFPTHDPAAMAAMADEYAGTLDAGPALAGVGGAGGDTYVMVDARGSIGLDPSALERAVVDALRNADRKGRKIKVLRT